MSGNPYPSGGIHVRIEQAIARGETLDQICSALNVDPARVDKVLRHMDAALNGSDETPPPPRPRERKPKPPRPAPIERPSPDRYVDAICQYLDNGLDDRRIGRELGISHSYVYAIRRRYNIPSQRARRFVPHGNHAAYVRHQSRGEQACAACIKGETAYQKERAERRAAA